MLPEFSEALARHGEQFIFRMGRLDLVGEALGGDERPAKHDFVEELVLDDDRAVRHRRPRCR